MSNVQEGNDAANCQNHGLIASRGGDAAMHDLQLHERCADWNVKCQSMNLNARCAKSVLKWIDQSMKNVNQSVAGQT